MINELDLAAAGIEIGEMIGAGTRAGHTEACGIDLLALLPVWKGPDILGMGREPPFDSPDQCCVACDRCRRVQEMRIEKARAIGQFVGQHAGLPETTKAVRRKIARDIA